MSDLLESREGGVAILTLNRPDRMNALSGDMLEGLLEALPRLANDAAIGAIVLTGAGRGFCAGGDVKNMATNERAGSLEERTQNLRSRMEVSRLLHEMPKVTIASVNGAAAGAGLSIALACDMRIAGESARFTTAFIKVGFPGDFGGTYFLTKLVGTAKARELYYSADVIDAREALRLGIVGKVVPDADLAKETLALAGRIGNGPRIAYRHMKRSLNVAESGSLIEAFDAEAWGQSRCGETEDHKEAARAFVEKRAPVFKGR
jgi:2-(1,2-epoxy-1,2-dihydrophenyl)acetyl-CoA isomerase